MEKTYSLTSENIDSISEDIAEFFKGKKQLAENVIRARLSVETALLHWLENGCENNEVVLQCRMWLGRPQIRVKMAGPEVNPLGVTDDYENYFNILWTNLRNIVTYSYARQTNVVEIKLPFKSLPMWKQNMAAIICAIVTWGFVNVLGPAWGDVLDAQVISSTFKMLLNFLKALASFMIFFNVVNAICHMGDVNTLSRLGMGLIKRAEKYNFAAMVMIVFITYLFFDVVSFRGMANDGVFGEIYKMLLNIVPESFVEPFITGNIMQISFMAVSGGILLLILGQQAQTTFKFVEEMNNLFMMAIVRFCTIIPLVVYLSFTSLLLNDKFSLLLQMWKIPVVLYATGIIFIFLQTLFVVWKNGFKVSDYFDKILSVSMLAYATASTMACIPLMTKNLTEGGVDEHYRDFALPLCQILCPAGIVIYLIVDAMGAGEVAGIKLSLFAFITLMFSVLFLAQTVPPVYGGAIAAIFLVLSQLNIPQELITICISMDFFLDMMTTSVSKTNVMNTVFDAAKQEGKLG